MDYNRLQDLLAMNDLQGLYRQEVRDVLHSFVAVLAERDQLRAEVERLRARLASGIVTYERNGTIFHEVRPSWPTSHIDPLSPRDAAAVQSAEAQEIEDALSGDAQ